MATKRHPEFWSYLEGMAKETSDFNNMVSRGDIPECKYYGFTSVTK